MAKNTKTPESDPARTQPEPQPEPVQPRHTRPATRGIADGLLVAQMAIRAVGKGSQNTYHKYKYTSSDDMIAACRDALHEGGLTLMGIGHTIAAPSHEVASAIDPDNPPMYLMLTSRFRLTHESGEKEDFTFELPAAPEKGRPLDKAILGCKTTSLGYFLRDLLQVPREDTNEIDQRDDRNYQPPQRQPNALRQPPQQPQGRAATTKERLWSAIRDWSQVPPNEASKLAEAGKRVFKHLNIPVDGRATEDHMVRALGYVNRQLDNRVDFAEWAADPVSADMSEGAKLDRSTSQTEPADEPSEDDIPY